jgi:hypothetical protein
MKFLQVYELLPQKLEQTQHQLFYALFQAHQYQQACQESDQLHQYIQD